MHTITLRPGQRATVGEVTLKVDSLTPKRVRLAIEAPDHVPVCREEVAPRFLRPAPASGERGRP